MLRLVAGLVVVAGCDSGSEAIIDRVVPSSGRSVFDVSLTIEGVFPRIVSDLDDGTTAAGDVEVRIGDVPLVGGSWQNASLIQGVLPARTLAPGSHPVTVTLSDREIVLPDGYTVIDAQLPLVPDDLVAPPGSVLVLPEGAQIDTTALTVTGAAPGSTFDSRADDAAPCTLAFVVAERIEVTGKVRITGTRSIVLVGQTSLVVQSAGGIDAGGVRDAGGPGGAAGGIKAMAGGGPSGGGFGGFAGTTFDSGGGGGGFAGAGGAGGASGTVTGGAGGAAIAVGLDRLCGGSGGGGAFGTAFPPSCPVRGSDGGGGGGGVMLGSYGAIDVAGAVNAGGAGGRSAECGGGAGGGGGGTIVLAAPSVSVTGVIAANGGGGGGGGFPGSTASGADGCACEMQATGGTPGTNGTPGGSGGAGVVLGGATADASTNNGGGGGGAVGRIFIATAVDSPPALDGIVSPATSTPAVTLLDLP